jgi:ABC-2 type transport system ATP-binding protein
MEVIRIENLQKTFRSFIGGKTVHALQGVNMNVKQGEIFGLLGPNGAGKTTLVKILLGIAFASGGEAYLFEEHSAHARSRDRVGYLPERHKYPRFLKGKEVLQYYSKLSGMSSQRRRDAIPQLLKMVRMDEWQNVKMGKYSKGMAQRLGLATAMIADPDLLVLDEPTDGVDPVGRKEIRDVLMDLKKRGKTIFLNSHLLSEVEMICDKIAVLDKGKVVMEGGVEELTAGDNSYTIEVEAIGEEIVETLRSKIAGLVIDKKTIVVTCENISDLNALIDTLRSNNVMIEEIRRKRISLEDMFIDVISKQGEASVQ